MSETDFYRWLWVVTRNQFLSSFRQFRKHGLLRDGNPVEDLDFRRLMTTPKADNFSDASFVSFSDILNSPECH